MTRAPVVSVLVTVYDRELYLAACLESILASTWDDFEIVISDDGSSDESPVIAEEFSRRDSRVRFYRNERNMGDYPNRMAAAGRAHGELIKYVDSDDLIYPHSLAIMVEAMTSNPDAALALSHSLPEDENPYPWKLEPRQAWRKQFLGGGCLACGPSGAIMNRERFFEAGGFRSLGVLSDIDLWYRMSAQWPVLLIQPGLVWWRRHQDQEYTKEGAMESYLDSGYQLDLEALESPGNPLSVDETSIARARVRQHHARKLLSLTLRAGHPFKGWQLFRKSGLGARNIIDGLKPYR